VLSGVQARILQANAFIVLTDSYGDVPFPGKAIKGTFIRRLTHPNSEISVNKANVGEAIKRQGADDLDTKVWWDK
jgi:hypothetical protein